MNMEVFSDALSNINSKYIEEVLAGTDCSDEIIPSRQTGSSRRKLGCLFGGRRLKIGTVLAVCLCALLVLASVLQLENSPASEDAPSRDGNDMPQVTVDGTVYLISPYLAASKECPDGFSLGGTISSGEYASCEYYVSPDFPDWVYVLQKTTIGEKDAETNTISSTEPYMGYVRYVNARIRGLSMVCFQDQLYLSMWNAGSFVDSEDYDPIEEQFGIRIEGDPLEGFSLAGTTAFYGFDTVPTGALSSNTGADAVYANPDLPDILLVSTSWYTATAQEQGETLHTGFNVYIKYELPQQLP